MFGNELTAETFETVFGLLHMDRETLENMSIDNIRIEMECLYDEAEANIIGGVEQQSVATPEMVRYNEVRRGYSLLMNEIEQYLNGTLSN